MTMNNGFFSTSVSRCAVDKLFTPMEYMIVMDVIIVDNLWIMATANLPTSVELHMCMESESKMLRQIWQSRMRIFLKNQILV